MTLALGITNVYADKGNKDCQLIMSAIGGHAGLEIALKGSVLPSGGSSNGGLDFHMWGTVVATDGTVCTIARTGSSVNAQWLGSRVISAQKANTAVLFSTDSNGVGAPGFALSTANLMAATQPGGSLYGLQFSNPVDTKNAYDGKAIDFGTKKDPLVNERVGGINIFGGGLALYDENGELVGALGVSGDTSCADHNVAWRTRESLGLGAANVPAGVGPNGKDGINYVAGTLDGFEHVECGNGEKAVAIAIGAGA